MGCLADGACRLVHLDAFDLYAQQHILLEAVLLTVVHTKVGAAECAVGIRSTNLFPILSI
jgi:hypothetical protein